MSARLRSQQLHGHRLFGPLFISGAIIGLVGNGLHPHTADLSGAATVQAIAGNGAWVVIHLAIIIAILLVIGGLVGLAEEMTGTPGEPLARLGLVAAVLGGSVVTVSSAIDGFVMKALSDASVSATGTDGALALSISVAVKDVDFGIWSIGMLAFFGVAFACFGGAVVASRRYPGWFGWIAIVGAAGSAVAALLQIAASGEVQTAETLFFASSLLLTLWVLALGILMWRGHADAIVDALSLASPVRDLQPCVSRYVPARRSAPASVRRPRNEEVIVVDDRRTLETRLGPLAVRLLGDGPPAVLWHSLFVDERSWGRVENDLATQRRLVIITGPGHGASGDAGRRYTLDDCAEAAGTVLDSVGIGEPVDWVGNAWGGHVGLVFAARWPERCRTLVTLGTPVQSLGLVERVRTISLLIAYRLLGPAGFIRTGVVDTLLSPKTRAQDPAAIALVEDALIHADPGPLRNAIVSISLRRRDLTNRLARVSVPTLFVTGSDHKGWSPQQAMAASKVLPSGSVAVVADAAYLVPFENPAATIQLVRHFWLDH